MPVNNECPPLLKPSDLGLTIATSDVTLFDGNLTCVTVPPGSDLNTVLEALDAAICNISIPTTIDSSDVTYNGTTTFDCLTLVGTDIESIIAELATAICVNDAAIDGITTIVNDLCIDDIDLCNILNTDLYACLFGSTAPPALDPPNDNLASLLSLMLQNMCRYEFLLNEGKSGNDLTGSGSQAIGYARDLKSIVNAYSGDTLDFTERGGVLTTSPTSFTPTIDDGSGGKSTYYVNGWGIDKDSQTVTVSDNSDNYVDVKENGDYIVTTVALAAPEPPVGSGSYRLFKIVTDGSGVVSFEDRQNQYSLDGTTLSDDSILTRHISDGAITTDQLEDVVVGATIGDTDIISLTYDDKGRVTAGSAKINITALADGEVLQYNLAGDEWVNVSLAGAVLPTGTVNDTMRYDGADWVSSSNLVNTGSQVGISISAGLPLRELTLGYGSTFGLQLPQVQSFVAGTASGGSLPANTFYYIITAVDTDGGESIISDETSATVDGITTTAINLTWAFVPLAKEFIIYRGTSTGVYTESQVVTSVLFTDDGLGWSPDVTPTHTDAGSYSWIMTEDGLRIGDGDLSIASLTVNSGLGKDFAMIVEAGYTGMKDHLFVSDDPVTAETIFPTSIAFGITAERAWDGITCVHAVNDTDSATAASMFIAGSLDGVTSVNGETIQMAYFSPSYVRTGIPQTGVNWYQNKGVLRTDEDVDGLVINVAKPNATLHFEMNGSSRMLLEELGSLGLGLDDTGATSVNTNAIFEMVSTSKGMMLPRWTTAQEITNVAGLVAGDKGLTWYNTDTDQFMGWNGTSAVILG